MSQLNIENLSYSYKEYNAKTGEEMLLAPSLKDISLKVDKGSIVLLCGPTGSGKSTLLKQIKNLYPDSALLYQNPEDQIVTDKVWHEVVFGLENMGLPQSEMENRLAEILSFFRIESIAYKDTATLSGGQKQIVCLASLLAMKPEVLLLDEPLSQLDPESSEIFLGTLKRLHDALGLTIIIAEHDIRSILPLSNQVLFIEDGQIRKDLSAKDTDAESLIKKMCPEYRIENSPKAQRKSEEPAIKISNLFFRYEKKSEDILRGLSASFLPGQIYGIFGSNAAGKSTLLNLIAGIHRPSEGKILPKRLSSQTGYLPQNVETLFIAETISEELSICLPDKTEKNPLITDFLNELTNDDQQILDALLQKNPFDLSGGQKQILGLLKVISRSPSILLLDEPTKGMDYRCKYLLTKLLIKLKSTGATILMSTHDIEFAASCADQCAILSMGKLTTPKASQEFFAENTLYKLV